MNWMIPMNKKLLLSVLVIACAATNISYGGLFRAVWKKTLQPYSNIERGFLEGFGAIDSSVVSFILVEGAIWRTAVHIEGYVIMNDGRKIPFQKVVFDEFGNFLPVDSKGKLFKSNKVQGYQRSKGGKMQKGSWGILRETRGEARQKELGASPSFYKRFTIHHPWVANGIYYTLLGTACVGYGTYKLMRKETRDKIKKNVLKVMEKTKQRFKEQIARATIYVSAARPK